MTMMALRLPFFIVGFLLLIPLAVQAGLSMKADAMCTPKADPTPCGPCSKMDKIGGKCVPTGNKWMCECYDTPPGGKVTGVCVATFNCEGKSTEKGGIGDAKGMMDALKQVMDMLKQAMQKKGGGGGGDKGQEQKQPGLDQGCKQYYQVTVPSTDPCAYYVPPTSNSLLQTSGLDALGSSGSEGLLDALDEGSALNVSDELLSGSGQLPEELTSQTGTTTEDEPEETASSSQTTGNLTAQQVNLQSGTRGDIVMTKSGATIYAQARDAGANTEVAGFYGSDTYGGQSQGLIAGMCKNRPWARSVVSIVIPPAFFDSLCSWRGYQVGAPAPPSQPVLEKKKTSTPSAPPSDTEAAYVPEVPPKVEIWAVPEKVPLGTRTSIFWNTSGVESCSITSPDGSFNETSLSGGAATVPLSGPATFTISCLSPSGVTVTDYVLVSLAI